MRVIFFGTPDYVVPILKSLAQIYEIVAVVTNEPKATGRKGFIQRTSVDNWAFKHDISVIYDLKNTNLPSADLGVLAAYGKIIPKSVINHFKFGILNVHPSLLPKYRGASPVQAAVLTGETVTGVTIITLDEKLDHGPIVSQFKEAIFENDTLGTLRARLFAKSAKFLIDLIPNYLKNKIKLEEQDHNEATFTKIVSKEAGFVNLVKDNPEEIERKLRAYTPWPGIWTHLNLNPKSEVRNPKRLKILKAHLEKLLPSAYSLVPDLVQLEGKNPVSWEEFKRGYPNAEFTKT